MKIYKVEQSPSWRVIARVHKLEDQVLSINAGLPIAPKDEPPAE